MKRLTDIKYNILYAFLIWGTLSITQPSTAQKSATDILDGVISGMGGGFDFDAMLSEMNPHGQTKVDNAKREVNLDLLASSMTVNSGKAAANHSSYKNISPSGDAVAGTLDFLTNAYSYQAGTFQYPGSNNHNYKNAIAGSAVLPITGVLTSGFGFRPKFGRMHKGVDIALSVGDTVVAAIDGVVERISHEPKGYGLFVCLRHNNGIETRYAHLSRALVVPGMRVMAGEPIALGGNTGNSTGPHLHFETRVGGTAVDPTSMFDFSMPAKMIRYRNLASLDQQNPRHAWTKYTAGTANTQKNTYIVRSGDTISSVAKKNGISVLTLCRLNMLSSNDPLTPGRMLKLR